MKGLEREARSLNEGRQKGGRGLEEAALADQVRKTVYHEIGHYFGLEERDLRRTSVE